MTRWLSGHDGWIQDKTRVESNGYFSGTDTPSNRIVLVVYVIRQEHDICKSWIGSVMSVTTLHLIYLHVE